MKLSKILTAAQTRAADQYTIANDYPSSWELMERASLAFTGHILEKVRNTNVALFCGTGNNGGDGLAVSRLLKKRGIRATPYLVKFSDTLSPDCQTNREKAADVIELTAEDQLPSLLPYDIIIDALFGSGLSRPVSGFPATIIDHINKSGKTIYAIDLPSGLYCDRLSDSTSIIRADLVVSFQRPKLAFFFPENAPFIKEWEVVDIGLNEAYIQAQESDHYLLDDHISSEVRQRARWSHKGTYGHALLLAGAYGKMGAAVLAARACLRSGCGLLTTYLPKCGYTIMQISVPEAMCLTDQNEHWLSELPELNTYKAIGIGPGIGKDPATVAMLGKLLRSCSSPLVLDADALNILSENRELLDELPEPSILTPHIKEFDRLAGESANSAERFAKQKAFAQKHRCIVVLKDAATCIASPQGQLFYNTSGNPGMATGGSGDVLTGIITGLLAQGYEPLTAALIGVYYHGLAGDKAAKERGFAALIASDIVACFGLENQL